MRDPLELAFEARDRLRDSGRCASCYFRIARPCDFCGLRGFSPCELCGFQMFGVDTIETCVKNDCKFLMREILNPSPTPEQMCEKIRLLAEPYYKAKYLLSLGCSPSVIEAIMSDESQESIAIEPENIARINSSP